MQEMKSKLSKQNNEQPFRIMLQESMTELKWGVLRISLVLPIDIFTQFRAAHTEAMKKIEYSSAELDKTFRAADAQFKQQVRIIKGNIIFEVT